MLEFFGIFIFGMLIAASSLGFVICGQSIIFAITALMLGAAIMVLAMYALARSPISIEPPESMHANDSSQF